MTKYLKYMVLAFALTVVSGFYSCDSDNNASSNYIYGLTQKRDPYSSLLESDSIIRFSLTTGEYTALTATNHYPGMSYPRYITHARKLNRIVYEMDWDKLGIIYLDDLSFDSIDLNIDSTFAGMRAIVVNEKNNSLIVIAGNYNVENHGKSLDIFEVSLTNKSKTLLTNIGDYSYTKSIFADIDELNHRVFIVPQKSPTMVKKLYQYDYKKNSLSSQLMDVEFDDVHYSSNKNSLLGTSVINQSKGLVSYHIPEQKTDTIGIFEGVSMYFTNMYYFDKKNNTYWLGAITSDNLYNLDLINVNLSDAGFSKRLAAHNAFKIIN